MSWSIQERLVAILPAGSRRNTAVIAVLVAIFMVSGLASRVMDTHETFAKPDRLAAISLILSGVPDQALPVTFLDVDDATRNAWKSQGATPHAALAELVRIAADGGARGILVDFDLSAERPGTAADPALLDLLSNYRADFPPLMLVRKIVFMRTDGPANRQVLAGSVSATPYDMAASGKPNIIWVTTLNDIGADRSVKRIRLWQTVCEGAKGVSFPSAALVTAAKLTGEPERAAQFDSFMAWRASADCGGRPGAGPAWPPVRDQSAYLPYVFGDNTASTALFTISTGGRQSVVLRRISAARLVTYDDGRAAAAGEIDRDPFAGRVAVIGASYTESPDIHETPLGTMPGSIIIANSVVQAETLTGTVPPAPLTRNVLALLAFAAFAALSRFVLSRAMGFPTGLEVTGAALTGFALFKLIDALTHVLLAIPKRGWRAILRS
jgi:CHASE2 domain-containing sensor protein